MSYTLPLQGSCLCGAVHVHITAPALLTLACHCRDCQKLSASAFSLTTMFPSDSFLHTGELVSGGRGLHGRRHHFCKSCLNFVFSEIGCGSGRVNLRTSMLDNADAFAPFVEVMTEEKMPWVHVPAVHSYPRFPGSLEELQRLMDSYSKQ